MKKHLVKIFALILALTSMFLIIPLQVSALSAKEQEDLYRVNTWWQDQYNQQYIEWLLNDDNFVYHLDATEGSVVHDRAHTILNSSSLERKENYTQILTSFIGLSYNEIRVQSGSESFCKISLEFLDSFKSYLSDTQEFTTSQLESIATAVNTVSEEYLNSYWIDTNMDNYGYSEIYRRISSAFENDPNADWSNQKEQVKETFFAFAKSDVWLKKLSSISSVFSVLKDSVDVTKDSLAIIAEAESYKLADEKLVELLRYISCCTTDGALRAACEEIIAKFDNNYLQNIREGIVELIEEKGHDLVLDNVIDFLSSKLNIYATFIELGIKSGELVANQWFNTSDTIKQMQSVYCVNIISTYMSNLLKTELAQKNLLDSKSQYAAEYAADIMYHMQVLISARKLGEQSYYNLKDSVYSSAMINVCNTLGWGSFANDSAVIEAWYQEFSEVIYLVEGSLYKTIPSSYYYEIPTEPKEDEYAYQNQKLIDYNGTLSDIYLPVNDNYNTIAAKAFNQNIYIKSVTIPFFVKGIETYAFYNCSNLKYITIETMDAVISNDAFFGCADGFTIYAYEGSTAQQYAIENNIDFVLLNSEWDDYQNYSSMADFVIENNQLVKYIGAGGEVFVPDNVTSIKAGAFKDCIALTAIVIPNSVTYMGNGILEGCTNLESITTPFIGRDVEGSYYYSGEKQVGYIGYVFGDGNYASPKNDVVPKSLKHVEITLDTELSDYSFADCPQIISVKMLDTTIEIGDYAFRGCTGLTSIVIPETVEYIGNGAFSGCVLLVQNVAKNSYIHNYLIQNEIPFLFKTADNTCPLGHEIVNVPATDATCLVEGNITHYRCTVCDKCFINSEEVSADSVVIKASHNLIRFDAINESCTINGNLAYDKCEICAKLFINDEEVHKEDVIVPASHNLTKVIAVSADCENNGTREYEKCTVCNKLFINGSEANIDDIIINASGHTKQYITGKPATCTSSGIKAHYKCTACGKLFDSSGKEITGASITIKAKHTNKYVAAKAATCTTAGNKAHYKCTKCGKLYNSSGTKITAASITIKAKHTNKYIAAKASTCTVAGNKAHYKCTVCGELFNGNGTVITSSSIKIAAKCTTKKYVAAKAATCTTVGNKAHYKCTKCGKLYNSSGTKITAASVKIKAKGHSKKYVAQVNATCTKAGKKAHYKCTRCGKLYTTGGSATTAAKLTIPAKHKLKYNAKVAPKIGESGTKAHYRCTVCGKRFVNGKVVTLSSLVIKGLQGWKKFNNGRRYVYSNGKYAYGWKTISGKRYYFNSIGYVVTGKVKINGTWYKFNSSGALIG